MSVARICHCNASFVSCQPDGKCQSPFSDNSLFFCLVTRRYNQFSGDYVSYQQCTFDIIDYGIYCNGPRVEGLVFDVSICYRLGVLVSELAYLPACIWTTYCTGMLCTEVLWCPGN